MLDGLVNMWCDRILGNLSDPHWSEAALRRSIDDIELRWTQCRRVTQGISRSGRPIRILLPPDAQLQHADVLGDDGTTLLVVRVLPETMIVVRASQAQQLARLALELGNLHWPTQIEEREIVFPEDGPALAVLEKMKLPFSREPRRFAPAVTSVMTSIGLARDFAIRTSSNAVPAPASAPARR